MNYITDSKIKISQERVKENVEAQKEEIRSKWEVLKGCESETLCGNVKVIFTIKSKAKLTDQYKADQISSYQQISSALALYRSISLFECGIHAERNDFYKVNWTIDLRHKETKQCLSLGEWKGGFQIFTEGHSLKDLNPLFVKEAEALLTLLVSETFTIGYDGVVAGSVA